MIWRNEHPAPPADGKTLPELVLEAAARVPGRAALIAGTSGEEISYGELARPIERVAGGLAARGIGRGDVVAVWAPNVPPWAGISLAAMRAGAAVSGIHPAATVDEARKQLQTARAAALVAFPSMLDAARQAAAGTTARHVIPMTTNLIDDSAEPPAHHPGPGELALLPFSSGTTGLPKGVMLTHANLTAAARQLSGILELSERDTILAVAPFAHVMGYVVTLAGALASGTTVVTMPRFDFRQALALVERDRVTVLVLPPPVLTLLARHPAVDAYDLSSVELIVSGGAPLGAALQEAVAARLPHAAVGQGYGLTETAVGIAGPDRGTGTVPGSVGRLIPGTELRIVHPETGADVPDAGEAKGDAAARCQGELWARGPQVMAGYLDQPEATAATLTPDGWLRTGDLGRIDADGNVFVLDRLKELIKVNALPVAPAELEALLLTHPDVADAAVVPRPDERAGQVPVAVVVPAGDLDERDLVAWVADRVAPHKRIRAVRLVDAIPRTPAGKILRRRLVEEDRGYGTTSMRSSAGGAIAAPVSDGAM